MSSAKQNPQPILRYRDKEVGAGRIIDPLGLAGEQNTCESLRHDPEAASARQEASHHRSVLPGQFECK